MEDLNNKIVCKFKYNGLKWTEKDRNSWKTENDKNIKNLAITIS